jgi:hypothetical protein
MQAGSIQMERTRVRCYKPVETAQLPSAPAKEQPVTHPRASPFAQLNFFPISAIIFVL